MIKSRLFILPAVTMMTVLGLTSAASAAGGEIEIERQDWSFGGIFGTYDAQQLRRGFGIYKEVCASCHGLKRIAFRNLAERGGPEFDAEEVKALAATYEVKGQPDDSGEVQTRPATLADKFPPLYANEKEARSIHNGALPPDLSLIAEARGVAYHVPWDLHPFHMLKDISTGYQEGGPDYIHALLTGYREEPPEGKEVGPGMYWNDYYPGHQIAMAPPLIADSGFYNDGSPETVEQYAKDVSAFLAWAGDPSLNQRKSSGWVAVLFLIITSILLYISKRRIWSDVH
jgi:ubiquinol-cytochrome c reductase cytochrome c1 subunit